MNAMHESLEAARVFAGALTIPVFLVDPDGDLLFYNTEAGRVLGRSFGDTGPMAAAVWGRIFIPTDENGGPLAPETLPLIVALAEKKPATGTFWIRGIDNINRHITVAAFPILGDQGKCLGAMAVFWEQGRG